MHGWYSQKQFENVKSNIVDSTDKLIQKNPYIYYLDFDDNLVLVTEVTSSEHYSSKFDDVIYKGTLKRFYIRSNEPLSGKVN
jgi:hypothetical protein